MKDFPILSRIDALNNAIISTENNEAERDEALEFIESSLEKLADYANLVIRQTAAFPIWKRRYEGTERLSRMEDSMYRRNRTHDAAIAGIRALDRLCGSYGVPEIFGLPEGDPKEESIRAAAAQCIGAFMEEAYSAGTESSRIGSFHRDLV